MLSTLVASALVAASPYTQTPASAAVSAGMRPVEMIMEGCYSLRRIPSGSAMARFRVGPDRRPHSPLLEDLVPDRPDLRRCLLGAVASAEFSIVAVGADVVYPIVYDNSGGETLTGGTDSGAITYHLIRKPRLFGSGWRVVDHEGRGVSDLDLARAAGDIDLQTSLDATERNYGVAALIEGAFAAAGIAVGIVGIVGLSDQRRAPERDMNIGLTAAGGGTTAIAGSLFLYHAFRYLEVDAPRPVWHAVDAPTARRLITSANDQ